MVERLELTRLRWRMRGAWLWPAFFGLTAVDGILIWTLPPYSWPPPGLAGGLLLAGFANLGVLAVLTPAAGRLLRRRRPDLPRQIAQDYAGTSLLCALALVVLVAGIAHRPAVAAADDDQLAVGRAVREYVEQREPSWREGLGGATWVQLAAESYRACVPGPEPQRQLCLLVDTDQRPPEVIRDSSMTPN